jgi:hypothetical protein
MWKRFRRSNASTDETAPRLKGKEFEPPRRRRDFQTFCLVITFTDFRYGTQRGRAMARGLSMSDGGGTAHSDNYIDAQANRIIEDQKRGFRYAKENAEKARLDGGEQQKAADREVAQLTKSDAALKLKMTALEHLRGPSKTGYRATSVVMYLLSLPVDYAAAMWTPLPPLGQWMLALLIGAAMVFAAHQAARQLEDLPKAHGERAQHVFAYYKELISLCTALGVPGATIVGTSLWRAHAFAAAQQATGGLAQGGAANVAFAFLATLGFVTVVLTGLSFQRIVPKLEIGSELAQGDAELTQWRQKSDRAKRIQRQAEVTLNYLSDREEHVIQAIRFWARERKARVAQRTETVAMRQRKLPIVPAPTAEVRKFRKRSGEA